MQNSQHKAEKIIKLPALVDQLRPVFAQEEQPVHLVGGAVRDLLLGRNPYDLDFAVPEDAIGLAFRAGDFLRAPAGAVDAIRSGQVVGMPTDTVYGLAVDPLNEDAVARLYDLKERPEHKPIGLLVAGLGQAQSVGEIEGRARELAHRHWPGALTLIVRPRIILADWVGDQQRRTVGLRVPDHPLAIEFLTLTGPLAVTSANRSGESEATSDEEARAIFSDRVAEYIPGTTPGGRPSTVIDATAEDITVLRRGPISV